MGGRRSRSALVVADESIGEPSQDPKRFMVALSDIHLGTDRPTVWYQAEVHESPLLHILDWVVDHAEQISELVLLGDIVDFWTYPAGERPPTFSEIAATHPRVFGPTGGLARVLDALDGRISYVPGNHDMGITEQEVASITSPGGHHVRLIDDGTYYPLPGGDTRLAFAHGHHYTLFNAPHETNPWAPLPVGYFVTRAVATSWIRKLPRGQTVADLPGQGAPNGLDLGSLGAVASGFGARSITATVLDFVSGATAVSQHEPMVMPDGSVATLADARVAYANCWTDWATAHGGGYLGTASAYRAAMADLDGSYLGWFAKQLAFSADTELVVMGHTHVPVSGLDGSAIRYVNTGFDCPSRPDRDHPEPGRTQRSTFAVIDTMDLEAEIWEVATADDDTLVCRPSTARRTQVVSGTGMDFSCYVAVDNTADVDLELVATSEPYGSFIAPPPAVIRAGTRGRFWIQDRKGPSGSEGTATYTDGEREIELRFTCPTMGTNSCSGWHDFATRTGDGAWKAGEIVRFGHPFFVTFTI